jgi:hypothetical protein
MPRQLDFADGFESSMEPTSPGVELDLPNDAGPNDIDGLLFDTSLRHAWVLMSFYRRDDTQEKASSVMLHIQYKTDGNAFLIEPESNFDTILAQSGITLSITAGGQVQYATTEFLGANYSGKMQFSILQQFEV